MFDASAYMKRKRLIRLSIVGVACLLMGACARSCIRATLPSKPWKVGEVSIREKQMAISLYFGSRQEAIIQPYDGVYRILEVSQSGKPPAYYDIPSLITMDRCRMEVFWYPTNNLVRFKDTALDSFASEFRSECLLDLNQNTLFAVIRGNGVTHIAKLSRPRDDLTCPQSHNDERIAYSYAGAVSELSLTSSVTVMIGTQVSKPIDAPWTLTSGTLIGIIEPK